MVDVPVASLNLYEVLDKSVIDCEQVKTVKNAKKLNIINNKIDVIKKQISNFTSQNKEICDLLLETNPIVVLQILLNLFELESSYLTEYTVENKYSIKLMQIVNCIIVVKQILDSAKHYTISTTSGGKIHKQYSPIYKKLIQFMVNSNIKITLDIVSSLFSYRKLLLRNDFYDNLILKINRCNNLFIESFSQYYFSESTINHVISESKKLTVVIGDNIVNSASITNCSYISTIIYNYNGNLNKYVDGDNYIVTLIEA